MYTAPPLPVLICLFVMAGPAWAAPVPGCPDSAGGPAPSLPLAIDLAGRPGVPAGVTGQIGLAVPIEAGEPPGVAAGCAGPPPPRDVLAGPPAADILMGPDPGQ